MTAISWERIYRPSERDRFATRPGLLGFLGSGERWVNLLLLFIALLAMSNSLESANWVDEMPSLNAAMMFGLVSGWVLAQFPIRAAFLQVVGLASGLAWVFGLVLARMELADPLLGDGVRARWSELWLRLDDWFVALVNGGVSSDPLPFVLMLVFAAWAVSYLSAWSVVRWHNAWAALIPPGFILLTNISYLPGQPSLQFVVFLFAAVLLVLQLHFTTEVSRWRRERVGWPDLMSLEIAFAGVWIALGLILVAWVVPTANNWGPVADLWARAVSPVTERVEGFSRVFIGVSSKRDVPVHGFGEVLPLQGHVNFSSQPLMEITTDGTGNLRGAVYDEYTGSGWVISSARTLPFDGTTVEAAQFGTPLTQAQLRVPTSATVFVLGPVPDRRLLSFGDAIAADVDASVLLGANAADIIGVVPDNRLRQDDTYTVVGSISAAAIDSLIASGRDYPSGIVERYTPLPDDIPPEVEQLTRQLVGTAEPYVAARIIEDYLRATYAYSTDVPDAPPLSDAVAHFLFVAEAGYFDHHATAMAVMLRTVGIPTRLAAGFTLDEESFDNATRTYTLTERDAWAWPEVYFDGLGWVEFNPTPGRSLIGRPGDDSALREAVESDPAFLSFDEEMLLLELEALFAEESAPAVDLDSLNSGGSSGVGTLIVRLFTAVVIAGAVAVVLILGGRFAWEYPFRDLAPVHRRWAKLQRLTGWAAIEPRATRTPLEWAREVAATVGEPAAFEGLARAYSRARYGHVAGELSDAELEALERDYRVVRRRLWRRILTRPLPERLRPRGAETAAVSGR